MSLEISTDLDRLDRGRIHDWLSDSYWASDRSKDVMDRAIDNSLCFGAYDKAGQLLGLARVVTDGAVFAYLCDVVVDPDSRGKGIGKALLSAVDAHPALQGVRRWILFTRDAHELYSRFGWEKVTDASTMMYRQDDSPLGMRGASA